MLGASSATTSSLTAPPADVVAAKHLDSDILALSRFVGLTDEFFQEVAKKLGMPSDLDALSKVHPRMLSVCTLEDLLKEVDGMAGLTFYTKNLLKTLHGLAFVLCTTTPIQTPSTSIGPSGSGVAQGTELALLDPKGPAARKVKMSNLIDTTDESECIAATPNMMEQWYAQYRRVKRGPPLVEKEPTPDQLIAMHTRVIIHGLEPYGDFSILTPHGRRMQKRLKHRSWIPQQDGSYQPLDVPGPPDLQTWEACWAVFETILLMLTFPAVGDLEPVPVMEPIAAEAYLEAFRTLARENPESWHLLCRAEDRARAEHAPRTYRKLKEINGIAPTWSQVFIAISEDSVYWDKEVRRPALQFLARNKRPVLDDDVIPGVPALQPGQERGPRKKPRGGRRPNNPSTVKLIPNQETQNTKGGGKGQAKGRGPHPRKDRNGKFITNKDGQELCFKFATGGPEKCPAPCAAGRAHQCQKCLQPHHNNSPSCSANA